MNDFIADQQVAELVDAQSTAFHGKWIDPTPFNMRKTVMSMGPWTNPLFYSSRKEQKWSNNLTAFETIECTAGHSSCPPFPLGFYGKSLDQMVPDEEYLYLKYMWNRSTIHYSGREKYVYINGDTYRNWNYDSSSIRLVHADKTNKHRHSVWINGQLYRVPTDWTILRCFLQYFRLLIRIGANSSVVTMSYSTGAWSRSHNSWNACVNGDCGMCIVEVSDDTWDSGEPVLACKTNVRDGMLVRTWTSKSECWRRNPVPVDATTAHYLIAGSFEPTHGWNAGWRVGSRWGTATRTNQLTNETVEMARYDDWSMSTFVTDRSSHVAANTIEYQAATLFKRNTWCDHYLDHAESAYDTYSGSWVQWNPSTYFDLLGSDHDPLLIHDGPYFLRSKRGANTQKDVTRTSRNMFDVKRVFDHSLVHHRQLTPVVYDDDQRAVDVPLKSLDRFRVRRSIQSEPHASSILGDAYDQLDSSPWNVKQSVSDAR
jgi:hypothetical protein